MVDRWARRHRTRLAAAGALAGGALLLARLAHRQLSLNTEARSCPSADCNSENQYNQYNQIPKVNGGERVLLL